MEQGAGSSLPLWPCSAGSGEIPALGPCQSSSPFSNPHQDNSRLDRQPQGWVSEGKTLGWSPVDVALL